MSRKKKNRKPEQETTAVEPGPPCHECGFPESHDIHVPGTADGHPFKPTQPKAEASAVEEQGEQENGAIRTCIIPLVNSDGKFTRECGRGIPCDLHLEDRIVYLEAEKPIPFYDESEMADHPNLCGISTLFEGLDLAAVREGDKHTDVSDICQGDLPCTHHGVLGARPLPPAKEALLAKPKTYRIADINLDQACNVREVISESSIQARMVALQQGAIQKPAVLWPQERAGELIWPGKEFVRSVDAQWVLLAGNITTLARARLGHTEMEACEFLGDAKAAQIYIGADNVGSIPMSSFELARYYSSLIGEKENQYENGTELYRTLKENGVLISRSHVANLVRMYRQLAPDIRAVWAKRRVLLGDETELDIEFDARLATDELLLWLAGLPEKEQLDNWKAVKTGTPWRQLKNPKPEAKAASEPKKFLGHALRSGITIDQVERRMDELVARMPSITPEIKLVTKYLFCDITWAALPDLIRKLEAPKKTFKKPVKAAAKKSTVKKKKAKARA